MKLSQNRIQMVSAQIKLFCSVVMYISSVIIAQMSKFEPLISQGFDQLISLGFFIVATVVLWRALSQKEKEISEFKAETIDKLMEIIESHGKKNP